MNEEQMLEKLGLTRGEINVYLALNKLGDSTISSIVHESKVSKSKIYDILERLIEKGLAGYVVRSGIKHFTSNDPAMLVEYVNKKRDELAEIKQDIGRLIPTLISQRNTHQKELLAEIYEGFQGVKGIREELMKTFKAGDTLLVLGAPKIANEKWEAWFLDFHKRRVRRNISMRIIYNYDAREYGTIRSKMKLTKVKYLPSKLVSPNWIDVFPEAVLIVMLTEKTPLAFVVRDKDVARSFKSYFEIMWDISKE